MQNQTLQNNLSVMGNSNSEKIITSPMVNLINPKKITDYCNEDYCLSCAYFQQVKGNFGRCTVLKQDKKFDGSKKGSACRAWRLNSQLIQIQANLFITKPTPISQTEKLRLAYNNEQKELRKERSTYSKKMSFQELESLPISWQQSQRSIQNLPYTQTSGIRIHRAYSMSHTPKRIIDTIVELYYNGKSVNEITEILKQKFPSSHRSYGSIYSWLCKLLKSDPELIFSKRVHTNYIIKKRDGFEKCPECKGTLVLYGGLRYNKWITLRRFYCKFCNKWFNQTRQYQDKQHPDKTINRILELQKLKLSSRQIQLIIKKEQGITISHTQIIRLIKQFMNNPQFLNNGSHRKDIRDKISISVKQYFTNKNELKVRVIA